ncbi:MULTISPECIES: TIGR04283 family arsenosugar biosynthesis glycosyltransferase [unclassified Leptolyngbya]|uniref:TIGR04283 family arsenosugar biosynthesis glycosyltransferase n=1 Tax=unclassified Leptolyngbya TaxID=2650499 RepID=UPI0016847684|nr:MULTISPECIES: TIGR04283 family arsenosugar biosynthesis glycosyltransferase [unclassified Leptolyngbya]MBD1913516.1 TIGR04283 family arsenosugar biosynthesis glycosyltransferase [Leptolyngbya sp. FACHB-8]MBD2153262.1 TIGR04283 family arsenosugar biosynthesis glycosyltransferase [Leptolyngbya sp. FACHB-16]
MGVSIIIPTLNEARCLERTLRCLSILQPPPQEILVVDGGSDDETVAIAAQFSATVLHSNRAQRSTQMNLGATHATGDFLCFVHADTLVPDDLVVLVDKALAEGAIACGGFISIMAGTHVTRWGITLHNSLKTYYAPLLFRPHLFFRNGLRLLFGDQVMFCRREDFLACGGFDTEMPILEEADLCLKLCRLGPIQQLNRVVQSSDRRVAYWGPLKANFIYAMIGFLWGFGVPAKTLKRFYDEVR